LVELRHALAVVVGHFKVNDRVHLAHLVLLAGWAKRSMCLGLSGVSLGNKAA
jgi:hypothetical protein